MAEIRQNDEEVKDMCAFSLPGYPFYRSGLLTGECVQAGIEGGGAHTACTDKNRNM